MKQKPSLIRTLLILALIAALLPLLVSSAYFHYVVGGKLYEQARHAVTSLAEQIAERVQSHMVTLNNTAYYLMANDLAQQVMDDGQSYLTLSRLEQQIDTLMTYNDAWSDRFIHSLFLFRDDGLAFSTSREGAYAGVRQRNEQVAADYPAFSSTRTLLRPQGSAFAYYVQDYYQIDTQQKLGRLIVEVDPNRLFGPEELAGFPHGTRIELTGPEGTLHALGEPAQEEAYRFSLPLGRFHIALALSTPVDSLMAPVTQSRTAFFGVQLLMALFVIGAIFLVRGWLQPQSVALRDNLEKLSQGDFSVQLPGSRYAEYDITARAFNSTTAKLGDLFAQAAEQGALLSQAEYQMLESQIDPHFIMNVLQTINMRCRLSGDKETADLVVGLGELLQSNVRYKTQQKLPLKQELAYVRYYLLLQQARFERLESSVEVEDEALLHCLVPKLCLQPLVENCFVHGLEDSSASGQISVSCWEEDGLLMLRVKDNGRGFDTKEWEERGPQEQPRGRQSGIALKNIRRRVELLYGPPYGLKVSSLPGHGTEVLLTLPMEPAKEEKEAAHA